MAGHIRPLNVQRKGDLVIVELIEMLIAHVENRDDDSEVVISEYSAPESSSNDVAIEICWHGKSILDNIKLSE